MDTKFDKLSRDSRTLAKQNQNSISNLTSESTALQEKLAEQAKKIGNREKTWNNTSHVLSSSLYGLLGWNPNQFFSGIERTHRGDYKNPNSPVYMKFISWKVFQAVLASIIRANRSRQTNISATQKFSDQVQKRMNRLLITTRI